MMENKPLACRILEVVRKLSADEMIDDSDWIRPGVTILDELCDIAKDLGSTTEDVIDATTIPEQTCSVCGQGCTMSVGIVDEMMSYCHDCFTDRFKG